MAELARTCRVSRARVSQVMDLLSLAPDIQTRLISEPAHLPKCLSERALRRSCAHGSWDHQSQPIA